MITNEVDRFNLHLFYWSVALIEQRKFLRTIVVLKVTLKVPLEIF